jgi:sugar phosphate isomerase/epimerase
MEKSLEALAAAGIRGCLTNFPPQDESLWEPSSRQLKTALRNTGVELLEYNVSFNISTVSGEGRKQVADWVIRSLELAEETGCLNVVACVANERGIFPDPRGHSREYFDTLKATCDLVARKAESRGLKARLMLELVYTTVLWSPTEMVRLVDAVDSPNVRAHMDIANCLTFDNIFDHGGFIRDSFRILGDRICSAHLKDVRPADSYFPGLVETLVGDGVMDIRTYIECLGAMPRSFPVVIEHMGRLEDIKRSFDRITKISNELGVDVWSE